MYVNIDGNKRWSSIGYLDESRALQEAVSIIIRSCDAHYVFCDKNNVISVPVKFISKDYDTEFHEIATKERIYSMLEAGFAVEVINEHNERTEVQLSKTPYTLNSI